MEYAEFYFTASKSSTHTLSNSSSAASIESASGNRGVILHPNSTGRLRDANQYAQHVIEARRMMEEDVQKYASVEERIRIEWYLLSLLVPDILKIHSP